ncbi:conjugal transfer protein TraF (plasmid) [Enterobacter hormaechei]|uniref:conjugal transfer protein TraF n=1 Tax=Enterobacter hormaechei TaxID=158836 RepID=UPI0027D2128E|nr:conjugal transfer protein TraF [Enterobacter hormaechei]WLZ51997.1 conjugal transfer protein TraF [Enterobacter hormaechei]
MTKKPFAALLMTLMVAAFNVSASVTDNDAQISVSNDAITQTLLKNRKNYALLYFVQPGCVYCQHQMPIINEFQNQTDWYVKTVDIIQNPDVRSKFNINATPVIVLIKKNASANNWQTVSIGYSPLTTLRSDIYKLIRLFNGHGVPDQHYARTQNSATTPLPR